MSQTAELSIDQVADINVVAQGKTFVWHQIFAPSAKTSIDFYTEALGWGTNEFPMADGAAYQMLSANGAPVAGVVGIEDCPKDANIPTHWSVFIGVDDVDARLAKCVALGATVLNGPMDIPKVGRMALIQDPQGATFWIFKGEGR